MKFKYSLLALLLFSFCLHMNAADITLDLEGHQGTVQWEQSTDGQTWTNINNAKSKTLAIPESSRLYYRAAITNAEKGLYYSEVYPAFSSIAKLDSAVWECHIPLMGNGLYGLDWFNKFETLSDRVWHENPHGLDKLNIMSDDSREVFNDCYRGVYRTSYALKHITNMWETMTIGQQRLREAQIRSVRAYYYFLLVTLFHNPPYYDETSLPTINANLPNGNPASFWNKIEADLDFSIPLLPNSYDGSDEPSDIRYNKKALLTKGAAQALLGKILLWKHYYYYLENNITEGRAANLDKAKKLFADVINSSTYALQGESNQPASKQDFLNCLISNTTHVTQIEGFDGKVYKGRNNKESVWEIQYGSNNNNAGGWLPGYMWDGAMNYRYFGVNNSSYLNHEMDPEAFYVYDAPAAGTKAQTAGFDRDPRAYASFYLDQNPPSADGSWMDWREESGYNHLYSSSNNSKRIVSANKLYRGNMPLGTGALMKKKYSYPSFTAFDGGSMPPNCDPFNIRVIRFADVLLMYAEACYLSGSNTTEGLAALNRVRTRAGMQSAAALNEATIIKERDMELMSEGFRYLDIIRWARSASWFNAINFSTNTPIAYRFTEHFRSYTKKDGTNALWYLPIPQDALNYTTALKQNKSWNGFSKEDIGINFNSLKLSSGDALGFIYKDSVVVESFNLASKVFKPVFETQQSGDKVYIGNVLQVSGESEVDFTSPVTYTIVSTGGEQKNIKVVVRWTPLSSENKLFSLSTFSGATLEGHAAINETDKSITITTSENISYRLNIAASFGAKIELFRTSDNRYITYSSSSATRYDLSIISSIKITAQDGVTETEYSFSWSQE